jgi:hypothetical protein
MEIVKNNADLENAFDKHKNYIELKYNPGKIDWPKCVTAVWYSSCSGKIYPPEHATVMVFYHKTDLYIEFGKILDLSISHSRIREIIGYTKNISIRGGDLSASIDSPNICIYYCHILSLHTEAEDILMEKCEFEGQLEISPKFLTLRHMTANDIILKGKCDITYINSAVKKLNAN